MRFVAGRGTMAERHREDVAGRGAVAGRHREAAAGGAPWQLRCCWQDAAGKEDARLHREAAAGKGRLNGPLLL